MREKRERRDNDKNTIKKIKKKPGMNELSEPRQDRGILSLIFLVCTCTFAEHISYSHGQQDID